MATPSKIYPDSKVEVRGFTARHYDTLMDIITLGRYGDFIRRAIALMAIEPGDAVLDMGCGSGRNACLMVEHLQGRGKLLGLDISEEMGRTFRKRCASFPNVAWEHRRIDVPLPTDETFDKVFIAFVLHGFPHEARKVVLDNAYKVLKPGGKFFILDYAPFSLKEAPLYVSVGFRLIECPYAFDFIRKDWQGILREHGFQPAVRGTFFSGCVHLLAATTPMEKERPENNDPSR